MEQKKTQKVKNQLNHAKPQRAEVPRTKEAARHVSVGYPPPEEKKRGGRRETPRTHGSDTRRGSLRNASGSARREGGETVLRSPQISELAVGQKMNEK